MFITSLIAIIILMITSIFIGDLFYSFFATATWTVPVSIFVASLYNMNINMKNKIVDVCVSFGDVTYEFFLVHQLVINYFSIVLNKLGVSQLTIRCCAFFFVSFILAKLFHRILLKKIN